MSNPRATEKMRKIACPGAVQGNASILAAG